MDNSKVNGVAFRNNCKVAGRCNDHCNASASVQIDCITLHRNVDARVLPTIISGERGLSENGVHPSSLNERY